MQVSCRLQSTFHLADNMIEQKNIIFVAENRLQFITEYEKHIINDSNCDGCPQCSC